MTAINSQTARVLAVLQQRPVSLIDFDRQPAVDGGNRITRLAARVKDLRDAGWPIEREMVAVADTRIAQYTLLSENLPVTGSRLSPSSGEGGVAVAAQHAAARCSLPVTGLSAAPVPSLTAPERQTPSDVSQAAATLARARGARHASDEQMTLDVAA